MTEEQISAIDDNIAYCDDVISNYKLMVERFAKLNNEQTVADDFAVPTITRFESIKKQLIELRRRREIWEDVKAEIKALKGDNFPNSYYIKIIDKHLQEDI